MQPRRRTRELLQVTLGAADDCNVDAGEVRDTTVAIEGIAVIETGGGVEIRVDGQILRLTSEQAWAMASALLELHRLRPR